MLQWTGGSRRKVATSRKSTHCRQKQYFEQRKRQRQAYGQENCANRSDKQVFCNAETRSLDILNLINLAVASQPASTELTASVDSHVTKISEDSLLGKVTGSCSTVVETSAFMPLGILKKLSMSHSAFFLKSVKLLIKVPAKGIYVRCQDPFQNILPTGWMTHSTRERKRPKLVYISVLNGTFCCPVSIYHSLFQRLLFLIYLVMMGHIHMEDQVVKLM